MSISIDVENILIRVQYLLLIKSQSKLEIEANFLNLVKSTYDNTIYMKD